MATQLASILKPVSFKRLHGWTDDDHAKAFDAFRRSAFHVDTKPYRTGSLGIGCSSFNTAYARARQLDSPDRHEACAFFEHFFQPFLIDNPDGFVTGFYEPVVDASKERTGKFTVPLYARPDDLVAINDTNRPAGMDPYFAFGRQGTGTILEYFDRQAIETGALDGRGLEIAWLAGPVDAFFIHVQGAARLRFADGTTTRITYAAKTGHPFTGPGRILAELGEIPLADVTMQSIRAWFDKHPDRIDDILWRNRSFIFFREAPVDNPALGPVAAAKVPLTPGRSLAVDRLLHTFGTPFFINAPDLDAFGGDAFRRLMIAQDTGSAIVGPARGDLFAGSGDDAGAIAGVIKHPARFYALLPKAAVEGHAS